MVRNDRCSVAWCTDPQPHTTWAHQQVLGTWFGVGGDERGMTTQASVYGSEDEPQLVIVLVDSKLDRWSCQLTWQSGLQLGSELVGAAERFRV